jgi:hypothetical protein
MIEQKSVKRGGTRYANPKGEPPREERGSSSNLTSGPYSLGATQVCQCSAATRGFSQEFSASRNALSWVHVATGDRFYKPAWLTRSFNDTANRS